jgi:tRNA A37 threonylcarbamoyladenosine dehydratase
VHERLDDRLEADELIAYRSCAGRRAKSPVRWTGGAEHPVCSPSAEALARSAVGKLTLVDFDEICITNVNRQLHALKGNVGRRKVDVMAERLRLIHPAVEVTPLAKFYDQESSDELLSGSIDYAVDAIDNLTAKAHLIARCLARGLPLVSLMGAAARLDPTRVRSADPCEPHRDPLARNVRKLLRQRHGIEVNAKRPLGRPAVFSDEPPIDPSAVGYDQWQGFRCVCPNGERVGRDKAGGAGCASRRLPAVMAYGPNGAPARGRLPRGPHEHLGAAARRTVREGSTHRTARGLGARGGTDERRAAVAGSHCHRESRCADAAVDELGCLARALHEVDLACDRTDQDVVRTRGLCRLTTPRNFC